MPENDSFSRDLGYLDKFFDKLEVQAGTLPPDAGQRLRALLAEERTRWAEIRQLVGGTGAPASATEERAAPAIVPEAAAAAEPAMRPYTRALQLGMAQLPRAAPKPAPTPAIGGDRAGSSPSSSPFTVGSLKSGR